MSLDGPEPMRRDAIFRIASMTKPFTAVAGLMPIEDGKLRLDGPVDRLLPELADRPPSCSHSRAASARAASRAKT